MKVHLVGGFLGSGKTTAITNSSKIITDKGNKTAVITNDQGEYLVDSQFVKQSEISFSEVTGGCFCCNYNQLDSQISSLKKEFNPSVIFAETVGSCTDLIATVLKPLLKYREQDIEQVTFSSFVDAQLLLMHLQNKSLPFNMETNYIWEKQIEEAEILIVNKIDLLSTDELDTLKHLANKKYPSKKLLFQNSLDNHSLNNWITSIDEPQQQKEHKSIDIDYNIYGAGEANLAWLDEELEIISDDQSAPAVAMEFIRKLSNEITKRELTIGHLKFFIIANKQTAKLSYTTFLEKQNDIPLFNEKAKSVNILVNARVQTTPEELRGIFIEVLNQIKALKDLTINENHLSYFQPGFPNPTYRMG